MYQKSHNFNRRAESLSGSLLRRRWWLITVFVENSNRLADFGIQRILSFNEVEELQIVDLEEHASDLASQLRLVPA
jgi:hypothetical protein